MILILAAVTATPSPSPSPDVCGGTHTNLLATLNRPSIGFSACAVKPREFLAELGYQNSTLENGRATQYPQGFLRYGVTTNWEVDVIGPAYGLAGGDVNRSGFFDSGLGAKYEIWHDANAAFATDLLYTLPTGAAGFTTGGATQTLNLDYSTSLSSIFSFATTVGGASTYAASLNGEEGRFFTLLPSAVITDQWNPRAQAFIEAFASTRTRPDGGSLFGQDIAFQYLLTAQFELDVEAGQTVDDTGYSHYVGFGFGARF